LIHSIDSIATLSQQYSSVEPNTVHPLKQPGVLAVTVRLEKPDALPGGAVAGVSITRGGS